MSAPMPFEIVATEGGVRVASNGEATLQVMEPEAVIFRRRAVKVSAQGSTPVEWAVAELGGVRAYFDGRNVVMTRRDLMP